MFPQNVLAGVVLNYRMLRFDDCPHDFQQRPVNASHPTSASAHPLAVETLIQSLYFAVRIAQMYQAKLFENEFYRNGIRHFGKAVHYHYVSLSPNEKEAQAGAKMVHSTMTEMIAHVSQRYSLMSTFDNGKNILHLRNVRRGGN